ncbi:MAG: bifunctional glutamate N-acetyltransferase/amino-acid acetyltransferase ArgJ [Acidimicrobiia bacterium]|nr:bifunctional glutamate N-acetyltransferase/amino-acid acetyltransferase ArgJ [Acidimicrobiia bacterium]
MDGPELRPVPGGVTAPAGFRSAALHCGIKVAAPDLMLLAGDGPLTAAAIFTTNLVRAAPVLVSGEHLAATAGQARALLINSGCANACTGEDGMRDARQSAAAVAEALGCRAEAVLLASTGVIGVALKMPALLSGIPTAVRQLARDRGDEAAGAIMTTDTVPKQAAVTVDAGSGSFTVGGMAKGAGMIEPHMATMLGVLTTDAGIAAPLLRRALVEAASESFNAITIDGDTSTNDSLFALASAASGVVIDESRYPLFVRALTDVARDLALAIVRDGEGATKVVAVRVRGAAQQEDARAIARTVAGSLLVKTAVHGGDPNWGRILAAAGRAGVAFDPARASVRVGDVLLFERGRPHDDAAPLAAVHLRNTDVDIEVDLGEPDGAEATIWTCDLSADYVRINAEYRT